MMEREVKINSTKTFDGFRKRAEEILYGHFAQSFENGSVKAVSIGESTEAGMHKIHGTPSVMASALYCGTMDKMISEEIIDPSVGGDGAYGSIMTPTMEKKIDETLQKMAVATVDALIKKGVAKDAAQKQVKDSLQKVGWYDSKSNRFVVSRVHAAVKDALPQPLLGLTTPYWNISVIQKLFVQPFLRGYAEQMVNPQGVPNMWADLVQIFTTTFEGQARVSSVASGTGEFNTSVAAKNRSHTMISQVINIVIDYESPTPNELRITNQPGNWLGGQLIGKRDAYANLMLRTLRNNLYYFGSEIFDGLTQIAERDALRGYDTIRTWGANPTERPMSWYWDNDISGTPAVPYTTGAQVVKQFTHLIGDIMELLNFMPSSVKVAVSPTVYKVLKFVLTSDAFVQKSPLSFISNAFEFDNKIIGTMSTGMLDRAWRFEMMPDPMLMPNTPGNPNSTDVMFITFPSWTSALEPDNLQDVIIAPVLVDNMILPSAPGYRDGTVRTNLSRIGSLLVPVEASVWRIDGFGTNPGYVAP